MASQLAGSDPRSREEAASPRAVLPITEDDATLAEAIGQAHLPSLLAAVVHLTGDAGHLDGLRPVYDFFGGEGYGWSAEQEAQLRSLALAALVDYRDRGATLPPPPSPRTVRRMMEFVAGQPIPERYERFLFEELALEGEDPDAPRWAPEVPEERRRRFRVLVIGAGMSGLLAGIRLDQAGIPYTILEKNEEVGGTWWENSYPGCRVDTPNHLYSYSFAPNHDWPQHYSTQDVLLAYFQRCADDYGVRSRIRFGTSVEEARWDEAAARWRVRVRRRDGGTETLEASAVVTAVGQLNRPRLPDIPGLERFRGVAFHSAEWQHEHDLTGKRVAVIGTGASAFQFVPEIAERTAELRVFQRSAPWLGPTPNYHDDVPSGLRYLLRHVPYYEKWYRFWLFWIMTDGLLPAVTADPDWKGGDQAVSAANDLLRRMLTDYIEGQVEDPELRKHVVPTYPPGGKRMLRDNGLWLSTLQRDDVRLVTSPIREVTETGIVTEDGEVHGVDVVIYGTGFQASRFLSPMKVVGRDGIDLEAHWDGDARAYLGITIPHFPNLFCTYGPNTNIVVNGSIIFFSECEMRYILGCMRLLLAENHTALEPRPEVHDAFNEKIDAANALMAWGAPQVSSWYKNARGRVSQNWPLALVDYWNLTRAPDPKDYDFS